MNLYGNRKVGRVVGMGIVILAIVLLSIAVLQVDSHPRTDDATVRANAIGFAPEAEGRLVNLLVKDNQSVHKGDLLFEIDPRGAQHSGCGTLRAQAYFS